MEEAQMNRPKEIIKDVSKQLVTNMIKHDITGWPPDCLMFAYQPVRPTDKSNIGTEDKPVEE